MNLTFSRRLARLEVVHHQGDPTHIFADRPLEDDEGGPLLANWREEVAAGRATVSGHVMQIQSPLLTAEEWRIVHASHFE